MYPVPSARYGQLRSLCRLATAAALSLAMLAPASAQTRPADIKAEERKDPASGDVVIINRKTRKGAAPNPYAPKKKVTAKEKAKTNKPTKTATPKPIIRRQTEIARRPVPILLPPLPDRNTARRSTSARLNQFPQSEIRPPERQTNRGPAPRRVTRRPQERRAIARRRHAPERHFRGRPWRQCRILARRCQAGLEGSCYLWQRRCI